MLKRLIDKIQIILVVFSNAMIARWYKVDNLLFTLKYHNGLGAGQTTLSIPVLFCFNLNPMVSSDAIIYSFKHVFHK